MPLYDYAHDDHQFEAFASMADCDNLQPCPECGVLSPRAYVAFAPRDYLETLFVWEKPDGTYALPADKTARMPTEYKLVELRETADKRRVERAMTRDEREKWERANIGKQMQREKIEAHNRSELRGIMHNGGYIIGPDGGRKYVSPMSEKSKDFARYAMNRNNDAPREKFRGEFVFDALSRNASNREDARGRDGQRIRK